MNKRFLYHTARNLIFYWQFAMSLGHIYEFRLYKKFIDNIQRCVLQK